MTEQAREKEEDLLVKNTLIALGGYTDVTGEEIVDVCMALEAAPDLKSIKPEINLGLPLENIELTLQRLDSSGNLSPELIAKFKKKLLEQKELNLSQAPTYAENLHQEVTSNNESGFFSRKTIITINISSGTISSLITGLMLETGNVPFAIMNGSIAAFNFGLAIWNYNHIKVPSSGTPQLNSTQIS